MELTCHTAHGLWTVRYRKRISMLVKFSCHLAVRAKKYALLFLCRHPHVGTCLTALLPWSSFCGPKWCHQNAHLFIFTPPGAAVRFADGARKSFSIATCLSGDLETGWRRPCPAVSKNDRPFSVLNVAPTNAGSRFFKTARESGSREQNGDFWGARFQRAERTKFTMKRTRLLRSGSVETADSLLNQRDKSIS